jgi:16S rRNA (cytosine967-C5)-methyltransferase
LFLELFSHKTSNLRSRFPIDQWHYYSVNAEKPREIAARILSLRGGGHFLENLLDSALRASSLRPEDRRFLQELVYGTVRWELTLDWLINKKSGDRPQKPLIQNLLRLALYQMFWLERVPSYAVVNETVEICKNRGFQGEAKFINALLRAYDREAAQTRQVLDGLRSTNIALGYSHPEWLCQRWQERWGFDRTCQLLEWNNAPPPIYARVNTFKTTHIELQNRWREEGLRFSEARFDWIADNVVFELLSHPPVAQLGSFQQGFFYIQDPSTLLAAEMLQAQPGERILDLCAAPGGKTTYIAQLTQNTGRLQAEDLDDDRLKLVEENAKRLGTDSITTQRLHEAGFDRVLVDAPCSNTGVMRRRIELRWRLRPEELVRLAVTQLNILNSAASRVRAGGTLVYSTCSLESEENQSVVREFLEANPEFTLDQERELTPIDNKVDGAYCARLIKRS